LKDQTTPNPITDPPANAISKAFPILVLAACVVLTFALVATLIPIKPASAEQNAPTTNDKPTRGEEETEFEPLIASRTATTITKKIKTLYSDFRKAIAPTEICPAITFILSVPASCFEIQDERQKVYIKAITPKSGIK
jgi:hypothetical protein